MEMTKKTKIFISHSSRDIAYVEPFVDLLLSIGVPEDSLFCSSLNGFKVPLNYEILDYLKKQFKDYDLKVFFFLSTNYYKSTICLMEMGAAWVLQQDYTSILLPEFDFSDVKGLVTNLRVGIKLDSDPSELKGRLNEVREALMKEFSLTGTTNAWERQRDNFVNKLNSPQLYWDILKKTSDNGEDRIPVLLRLLKVNPDAYDAKYLLGRAYESIGDYEDAQRTYRDVFVNAPNHEIKSIAEKRILELREK